jgi:phosphoenolpyruvate carboxykinase (ATP)
LEWETWDLLPGTMIPTHKSINKVLPGFYEKYDPKKRNNFEQYKMLLHERFHQRVNYLKTSDLQTKPELLNKLITSLTHIG